jgi:cell growth-regulating nucleolar protein
MVNFICDACGQTIKKQKVEKHYQTECRNCSVLSCIDCGKDFPGDSYVSHTSCISEAEKYQGKLYKGKEKGNKGERKQQEWLEVSSLQQEFTIMCYVCIHIN